MATRVSSEQALEESFAKEFVESIKESGKKNVEILMIGKTGSGKTSLANALLYNESTGGTFGPSRGTSEIFSSRSMKIQDGLGDITITIHDIMGLEDVEIPEGEIVAKIHEGCKVPKLTAIILCQRWNERFNRSHQRILKVVHGLGGNVWEKIIMALTFCDELSPEVKAMKKTNKIEKMKETCQDWKQHLRSEVLKLNTSPSVVENIPIVPTSHTGVKLDDKTYCGLFNPNTPHWLENIWSAIIDNAIRCQLQDSMILEVLTLLAVFLKNRFPRTAKVTIEDVKKFLTTSKIAGVFLGASIGAGVGAMVGAMGSISGILLSEIIAAAIGLGTVGAVTATVATGGIAAGVLGAGAVASIVIVIIYCIYKYRNKKVEI